MLPFWIHAPPPVISYWLGASCRPCRSCSCSASYWQWDLPLEETRRLLAPFGAAALAAAAICIPYAQLARKDGYISIAWVRIIRYVCAFSTMATLYLHVSCPMTHVYCCSAQSCKSRAAESTDGTACAFEAPGRQGCRIIVRCIDQKRHVCRNHAHATQAILTCHRTNLFFSPFGVTRIESAHRRCAMVAILSHCSGAVCKCLSFSVFGVGLLAVSIQYWAMYRRACAMVRR
jgi:hypothetical protein